MLRYDDSAEDARALSHVSRRVKKNWECQLNTKNMIEDVLN